MKTALWILAICELIKLIVAILGGIATAKLKEREREIRRERIRRTAGKQFERYIREMDANADGKGVDKT